MSIYYNGTSLSSVYYGNSELQIYQGSTLLQGVPVQPLRIAGTGGEIPLQTAVAGNTSQVRIETDRVMKIGKAQKTLAVAYCNFYISGTRVETNTGNAVDVRAHFRIDSAPTTVVVATWDGGASSHSMADGEAIAVSDEVKASDFGLTEFAAGTVVYVRTSMTVNNAERIPTTRPKYSTGGEAAVRGPSTSTQIGSAGALTVPAGWATITNLASPLALLGRASRTGAKSAVFFGDSIVYGFNDNEGYGDNGGGIYARGAWDIDGSGTPLPWAMQAKTGTTAQQAASNYTKQSSLWSYATHFICNLGTNDAGAGRTAAQCFADLQTVWGIASGLGCKVVQADIMARANSSSDGWTTVAGETITTAYQTGGTFRDPLNADFASSTALTSVLDCDANWADPTLTDHIRAPGYTSDGIHPIAAAAALIAPALATQFAAL